MKKTIANISKAEWFLGKDGHQFSVEAEKEIKERTLAGTLDQVTEEYSPKFVILTLAGQRYGIPKSCLPYVEEIEISDDDYKEGDILVLDGRQYEVVDTSDTQVMLTNGHKVYTWSRKFVTENMRTLQEYEADCVILDNRADIVAEYPELGELNDNELIGRCFAILVGRYYNDLMECCSVTDGTERDRTIEDFERRVLASQEQYQEYDLTDPITLAHCRLNIGDCMANLDLPRQNRIGYTDKYIRAIEGLWMISEIIASSNYGFGMMVPAAKTPTAYLSDVLYGMLDERDAKQLREWRKPNFKAMNAAKSTRKYGRI